MSVSLCCQYCGSENIVQLCDNCQIFAYCSRECMKNDKPTHANVCQRYRRDYELMRRAYKNIGDIFDCWATKMIIPACCGVLTPVITDGYIRVTIRPRQFPIGKCPIEYFNCHIKLIEEPSPYHPDKYKISISVRYVSENGRAVNTVMTFNERFCSASLRQLCGDDTLFNITKESNIEMNIIPLYQKCYLVIDGIAYPIEMR